MGYPTYVGPAHDGLGPEQKGPEDKWIQKYLSKSDLLRAFGSARLLKAFN